MQEIIIIIIILRQHINVTIKLQFKNDHNRSIVQCNKEYLVR